LGVAPRFARDAPHDLELVAVGIGTVERLGDAVVARATEGAGIAKLARGRGEVLDGRDLPGEVVQADRATRRTRRLRADREEAEIVVVVAVPGTHEHGATLDVVDDLEAEEAAVEIRRRLRVADVEDGVVEFRDRDHGSGPPEQLLDNATIS